MVNERAVRILLECILVLLRIHAEGLIFKLREGIFYFPRLTNRWNAQHCGTPPPPSPTGSQTNHSVKEEHTSTSYRWGWVGGVTMSVLPRMSFSQDELQTGLSSLCTFYPRVLVSLASGPALLQGTISENWLLFLSFVNEYFRVSFSSFWPKYHNIGLFALPVLQKCYGNLKSMDDFIAQMVYT